MAEEIWCVWAGGGGEEGRDRRLCNETLARAASPWQWCPCVLASLWSAAQPQSPGPAPSQPPQPAPPAWPGASQGTASTSAAYSVSLLVVGVLCQADIAGIYIPAAEGAPCRSISSYSLFCLGRGGWGGGVRAIHHICEIPMQRKNHKGM